MRFSFLSLLDFLYDSEEYNENGKYAGKGIVDAFKKDAFKEADSLSSILIDLGIEVENVSKTLPNFEEAILQDVKKHPNADSLMVCSANGKTIVCGDQTIKDGDRCILANIGAIIPSTGKALVKSKIRDIESQGMLCSAAELLIQGDDEGVIKLQDGEEFQKKLMPNGPIFEVSITPNRGDLLCLYGIARDIYAFKLGSILDYDVRLVKPKIENCINFPDVESSKLLISKNFSEDHTNKKIMYGNINNDEHLIIEDFIKQMYFLKLSNISSPALPITLKRKLFEVGIQPESPILDVCKYIVHLFGQPISAFDADLLGKISFKIASVEDFEDIKGQKFKVKDVLCMFSDDRCIQICGVADAKWAVASDNTKNVLLQAGNYSREAIFKAQSQMHVTDFSKRFSYGIDPEASLFVLKKVATEISSLQSPEQKPIVDFIECQKKQAIDKKSFKTREALDYYCEKNLIRLGFEKVGPMDYSPPSWRSDIIADECLETELMKHDNLDYPFGEEYSPIPVFKAKYSNSTNTDLRIVMATFGLYEVFSRHFMSKSMNEFFQQIDRYHVKNPMNQSQFCLRNSILPSILETFSMYKRYNWQARGIFEMGRIFKEEGEIESLGVAISEKTDWLTGRFSYYNAKSIFENAVHFLYGENLSVEIFSDMCFADGCLWKINGRIVAKFGKVNPSMQKKLKCKESFYIGEILLSKEKTIVLNKQPLSEHEVITKDLSVIIKPGLTVDELLQTIRLALEKQQEKIEMSIFDIYPDAKLSNPDRSVGIRFSWPALQKTLSSEEIRLTLDAISDSIREIGCKIKES